MALSTDICEGCKGPLDLGLLPKELNRRHLSTPTQLPLASSFNRTELLQEGLPGNGGHRGWILKREPDSGFSRVASLGTYSVILDTIQPRDYFLMVIKEDITTSDHLTGAVRSQELGHGDVKAGKRKCAVPT